MKIFDLKSTAVVCVLIATTVMSSCKKDVKAPNAVDANATQPRAVVYSSIYRDFYSQYNREYTHDNYKSDFGNDQKTSWRAGAQRIEGSSLRVRMEPNALQAASGCIASTIITDKNYYKLTFDTKFLLNNNDQLDQGGKVGWGLGIGSGGSNGNNNNGYGGSVRIMWHKENGGWYFKPYIYHAKMPGGSYGQQLNCTPYRMENNVMYNILIEVKTNTSGNEDGFVKVQIKKSTDASWTSVIWNGQMKWTHNGSLINRLNFDTFRGGGTSDWQASEVGYILFDNLHLR